MAASDTGVTDRIKVFSGAFVFEDEILQELEHKQHAELDLINRIRSVSNELEFVLQNIDFCKAGTLIRAGRKYSYEDALILSYEFYLLARKFKSIPTSAIETLLSEDVDTIKQIAAQGRLNHLIDLM